MYLLPNGSTLKLLWAREIHKKFSVVKILKYHINQLFKMNEHCLLL